MKKKYGNEFKVGIFVVLCILGLLYLTVSTGKLNVKQGGYYIYVVFDDIAGLDVKAPVMLNGREVGKVSSIDISYKDNTTKNILKLWLPDDVKIRKQATVSIKTLGLMGEKYIQITSNEGMDFLEPNTILQGKPLKDLDVLMDQADSITEEVKKLTMVLNNTLEGNQDEISRIIANLEVTSKNIQELTEDIKRNPWKLLHKPRQTR